MNPKLEEMIPHPPKVMSHSEVMQMLQSTNLTTMQMLRIRVSLRLEAMKLTRREIRLGRMESETRMLLATAKATQSRETMETVYRKTVMLDRMSQELEEEREALRRARTLLKLAREA